VSGLLLLLVLPACAALAGCVAWLIHRDETLEDNALLLRFAMLLAIALLLGWRVGRSDAVRTRIDPAYRIARQLAADPLVDALRRTLPGETTLEQSLVGELARGRTLAEAKLLAQPLLVRLATERMGFADAPTQAAWGKVVRDRLSTLQARDPALCYAAMRHQPLDSEVLLAGFDAAASQALEQGVIRIHESADEHLRHPEVQRAPRASFDEAQREYGVIAEELARQYGDTLVRFASGKSFPEDPGVPLADACEVRLALLDAALDEPQPMAAALVDGLLR
jgi:hypothetical protein